VPAHPLLTPWLHGWTCFSQVDILVNNAGLNIPDRALSVMSVEDWHKVLDVNLNGAFHMIHAFLPQARWHCLPPLLLRGCDEPMTHPIWASLSPKAVCAGAAA
jgi:NAD(P)-dependent dehydrogenase (short-subunit alcohol dehydrogenase family)